MRGGALAYVVVTAKAKAELMVYNVSAFAKPLFIMVRNAYRTTQIRILGSAYENLEWKSNKSFVETFIKNRTSAHPRMLHKL